jgi:hypothetical protein
LKQFPSLCYFLTASSTPVLHKGQVTGLSAGQPNFYVNVFGKRRYAGFAWPLFLFPLLNPLPSRMFIKKFAS